jgi:hypothetical protein
VLLTLYCVVFGGVTSRRSGPGRPGPQRVLKFLCIVVQDITLFIYMICIIIEYRNRSCYCDVEDLVHCVAMVYSVSNEDAIIDSEPP